MPSGFFVKMRELPRTTPKLIWAETPNLVAVGEEDAKKHRERKRSLLFWHMGTEWAQELNRQLTINKTKLPLTYACVYIHIYIYRLQIYTYGHVNPCVNNCEYIQICTYIHCYLLTSQYRQITKQHIGIQLVFVSGNEGTFGPGTMGITRLLPCLTPITPHLTSHPLSVGQSISATLKGCQTHIGLDMFSAIVGNPHVPKLQGPLPKT